MLPMLFELFSSNEHNKGGAVMTVETPEKIKHVLVAARSAAQACGVGLTLWKQLTTTGRHPEPIRLRSKILWSTRQLELWALNGCPSRDSMEWQKILERERNEH